MRRETSFLTIVLALIIATLPLASCGGTGSSNAGSNTPTASPSQPAASQDPVIKNLTANPASVKQDEITELRCEATDPAGSDLEYVWTSNGGVFSGQQNKNQFWVNWRAPKQDGTFNLTVTVKNAKGLTVSKTLTMVIGANRPPIVSGVTVSPATPVPGETCTLTAAATDPDSDALTYKWLSNNDPITSVGNNIGTWIAPNADGVYDLQVEASDGKDNGKTTYPFKITVQSPSHSVTLTQVVAESGTVLSSTDLSSDYRVGDNEKNIPMRAYLSFDLSTLAGAKKVTNATLIFNDVKTIGNPFSITPNTMAIEPVSYPARALKAADYNLVRSSPALVDKLDKAPSEFDVTDQIAYAVEAGNRYQIRLLMNGKTNYNNQSDYIEVSGATLKITFTR